MQNWFSGKIGLRVKALALVGGTAALMVGSLPAFADDDGNKKNTLVVDDDLKQCPNAQFTEIQDAVVAAPSGATIHVCPGTYKKQVIIMKPLTITADTGSILQPIGAVMNSSNADYPNTPVTALLLVMNTRGVSINDLTVDGSSSSPSACLPEYVGVMYKNASGQLTNMAVRNIKLGTGLEGCQSGEAIFVQNDFGNLEVDISDSSVHDYQKTGILIDRAGSNSTVKHNYVTGLGSTPKIAQNGIQISRGASATVTNNFVNNHLYALCTSDSCGDASSTNILIMNASNSVTVRNNTAVTAQIGIAVMSNSVQVQNNDVYDNKVFDGIDLLGNNNHAGSNNIFHSDTSGVYVEGTNNSVDGNTINEAPFGVLVYGSNQVNGNTYFNVPVPLSFNPLPPPMMTAAPVHSAGPRTVSPR